MRRSCWHLIRESAMYPVPNPTFAESMTLLSVCPWDLHCQSVAWHDGIACSTFFITVKKCNWIATNNFTIGQFQEDCRILNTMDCCLLSIDNRISFIAVLSYKNAHIFINTYFFSVVITLYSCQWCLIIE